MFRARPTRRACRTEKAVRQGRVPCRPAVVSDMRGAERPALRQGGEKVTARLFRSRTDHMIGGVCGGLGIYLGIDPTLVRLFFVLLALANGIGALAYLALWIVVPREDQGQLATAETMRAGADEIAERARTLGETLRVPGAQRATIIGIALIALGVVLLLQNLNLVWLRWLRFDMLWPLLLIAGGLALIWRRLKGV